MTEVLAPGLLRQRRPAAIARKSSDEGLMRGLGRHRAERFLLVAIAIIRALNLAQAYVAVGLHPGSYRSFPVSATLLVAATVWSIWVLRGALRNDGARPAYVLADVGVVVVCAVVVGRLLTPEAAATGQFTNWSSLLAFSGGVFAGAELSLGLAGLSALLLTAGYVAGLGPVLHTTALVHGDVMGNLLPIPGYLVFSFVVARYLRATGDAIDDATRRAVHAESEEAAVEAQAGERLRQYTTLHDTVLATLTAIARGGLDHRRPEVQKRCEREAAYLRRLISIDHSVLDTALHERLTTVVSEVEALGLSVNYQADTGDSTVPTAVIEALGDATRAALLNVWQHAPGSVAWVTVTGAGSSVTLQIVDQGGGFNPELESSGLGIRRSIKGRMADVGGRAVLTSLPSEGTAITLMWPTPVGSP